MKIAIVKLSALGDIVHSMVVLQFIKKHNQEIMIDWFVDEGYKELLECHPDINKVHSVNISQAKKQKSISLLIKEFNIVRKLPSYDLVIDMQGLIKSAIISKLIPSRLTLGFDKFSIRERFASIFYNKTFSCSYSTNVIRRNMLLIGYALGLSVGIDEIHGKDPFLYPRKNILSIELQKSKKNILLIPGASNAAKRYPSNKLAAITELIDANFFVIWGTEEEKFLAQKIKAISPNVTICKKLQLDSLISLISKVDLVIGPDTGPTHIAWALNVPSITLFGPTPGYRNAFKTSMNKVIDSDSKVNPFKIDKDDYSIKSIEEKQIAIYVKLLIDC
jgi:heptosyltransferase I